LIPEEKLKEMGLTCPSVPIPVAAYVPAVFSGEFVYTSGQLPFVEGSLLYKGKLGRELGVEQGYEAARACILNCLGAVKAVIGELNRIERVIKVTGYVNSAYGFKEQHLVLNGASELLLALFGEAGRHVRSAVGVTELPLGAPVEVELTVRIMGN